MLNVSRKKVKKKEKKTTREQFKKRIVKAEGGIPKKTSKISKPGNSEKSIKKSKKLKLSKPKKNKVFVGREKSTIKLF